MSTSPSLYCDECGAALTTQEIYCPVCHYRVASVVLPGLVHVPLSAPSPSQPLLQQQDTRPLEANSVLNNRYIILEQVGSGGFGLVYKARDTHNRSRLVAVKQINLNTLTPKEMIEATDSYNREIALLPRLHHKSIPTFYDHFTDPAHWYVVMDFIDGITLEEYLQALRRKRLSFREIRAVGLVLSDVLHYLHTQNPPVIFRDVKPANVMRTKQGQFYLIDFGIARQYVPGKRRDTMPLGSPGYAAPEQYGKAQTNVASDIYGLGALLQTLITGKDPGDLPNDKKAQKWLAKAPPRLKSLIEQMLQADPAQRPGSMLAVKYHLENYSPDSLLRRVLTAIPVLTFKLFNRYLVLWLFSAVMAWFILHSSSLRALQYFLLLLILFLGFALRNFTEEIEMQPHLHLPNWRSVAEFLLKTLQQAAFPTFCLTLFCGLYFLAYQDNNDINWALLYDAYYTGIIFFVVGFCLFMLVNLLRQFFLLQRRPSTKSASKGLITPLQQFRRR